MEQKFLYNQESTKSFRRNLRSNATDAERKIWERLRGKQVFGLRFSRQYAVGNYILDFFCPKRLAIEIDGGQHTLNVEHDAKRTKFLNDQNIRVERFWNNEVLTNIDGVMQRISAIVSDNPT